MTRDEEATFEEALENLREAAQRIRAVSERRRATGMYEDPDHHGLVHRVALALASSTEAAGPGARRKLGRGGS